MYGFVQLIKNLVYLSKFSLKNTVMKFPYYNLNLQYLIEDIVYKASDSNIKKPKIYNENETLNILLNGNMSLARFGDGEIEIISGKDIPYQKFDKKLSYRLKEILKNEQENLMVGINHWYFNYIDFRKLDDFAKDFSLYIMPKIRNKLMDYINFDKQYCDAGISKLDLNSINYYEKFKNLWKGKEIVVVGCKNAINSLKYNIYDCANLINYLYVPNINSYDNYNEILEEIKKFKKDKLIILMAGPA